MRGAAPAATVTVSETSGDTSMVSTPFAGRCVMNTGFM